MAHKSTVESQSRGEHAEKPSTLGAAPAASAGSISARADDVGSQSMDDENSVAAPPQKKAASSYPVGFIRQYELVDLVKAYDPDADEDLLNRAYIFSMRAHGDQKRKSGDPYFTHPLAVAAILTELRADPASIATALLHDTVEDTEATLEDINRVFGAEIARLVDGVTKLTQIELRNESSKQAENFRKLVMAMADDVRVLLVKLADRLHNMRTLHHIDKPAKRQRIARETMEIYAPLAGRIGVHRFREELEDIAFRELNPEAQETIAARLEELQQETVHGVVEVANALRDRLAEAEVPAQVYSREKRAHSIWRKMSQKNISFDELADIYAFRILVDSVEHCYKALGVIHMNWRMIASEFDDYISAPKPNNYRSIHTALIGPPSKEGRRQKIEVQIRTYEMHEKAERGVAAHWQYKDPEKQGERPGVEISPAGQFDPYDTPRRLVEMFQHGEDPDEALRYAKLELFQDQVFCFTPKGQVIALPKGATPLDFAYAVHTRIGDECIGAEINGVQRPLRTSLKNGDVVRILRSENAPVPSEWEAVAFTGKSRSAIRRRIKKMEYEEHRALGRSIAESVFSGEHLQFSIKGVRAALETIGQKSVDDVLAAIGRGDLSVNDVIEAVYPGASHSSVGEIRAATLKEFDPRAAIIGLAPYPKVEMARCCLPLPGERIVGIRGDDGVVTIHTIHCDTLAAEDPPQERWIDLKWRSGGEGTSAQTRIMVNVYNGVGVLSEIAGIVGRYGVSISTIHIHGESEQFVDFALEMEVKDVRQVEQVLAGLRAAPSVIAAERTGDADHE